MRTGRKLLLIGMLVASLPLLQGCGTFKTPLYPITDKDIFFQENGNVCFSPFYMEEVLKVKVKNG